jgi:site-specific DNA-methyltransferase (adenine-specific)
MNVVFKKIEEIIPYKNNPRKNDKAVESVMHSIKSYGFKNPILIDENNEIIAGHTRLKAAIQLGLTFVPIIQVTDMTEQEKKGYRIADNKVSENAEWDMDLLRIELQGLNNFTGFNEDDLDQLNFENVAYKEKEPKAKIPTLTIRFENDKDVKTLENDLKQLLTNYERISVTITSGEV